MMHVAQFSQFSTFSPVYAAAAPVSFSPFSAMVTSFQPIQPVQPVQQIQTTGYAQMTTLPMTPVYSAVMHVAQPNGFYLPMVAVPVAYGHCDHGHGAGGADLSSMQEPSWAEKAATKGYGVDMQAIVENPVQVQEQEEENYFEFLSKGKEMIKELMGMDSTNGLDFKFGIDGVEVTKDDSYEFLSAEEKAEVDADLAEIEAWMNENSDEIKSAAQLGANYIFATSAINIESYTNTDRSSFNIQGKALEYAQTLNAYARNSFGVNNDVPLSKILGDHDLPTDALFEYDPASA